MVLEGVDAGEEVSVRRDVEAKVTSYDSGYRWDNDASQAVNEYKIITNKGTFVDKDSKFHLKDSDDTARIWSDTNVGQTYKFKTYGIGIGPLDKNILSMTRVSDEELKEREDKKQEALKLMQAEIQTRQDAETLFVYAWSLASNQDWQAAEKAIEDSFGKKPIPNFRV